MLIFVNSYYDSSFYNKYKITKSYNSGLTQVEYCEHLSWKCFFFSFGTWTTSPPWQRGVGSVTLTICEHCVLCVTETSQPNKTKNVPNRSSASWQPNVATSQRSFQCSDSVSLTDTVLIGLNYSSMSSWNKITSKL